VVFTDFEQPRNLQDIKEMILMAGVKVQPNQLKEAISRHWGKFEKDIKDKQQISDIAAIIQKEGAIKGERLG
jgi:acyl-CoA synthetase (AMP-forming)/AMP-acid ligase II